MYQRRYLMSVEGRSINLGRMMLRGCIASVLVGTALGTVFQLPAETVEVKLKQGRIQGVIDSIGDSRFSYSRGIPYTEPALGELRYKETSDGTAVPWSKSTDSTRPAESVIVQLKQGKMQGVLTQIGDSRFFYTFRGVPYATPPVGDLRFEKPLPPGTWSGVRRSAEPNICPQFTLDSFFTGDYAKRIGEEDCLYLHVYTPDPFTSDLAVMVNFHGGGFLVGFADAHAGSPERLLSKDIVLVSIQYRLGTLGFLSTEDSVLPGNLGLRDQSMGLHWIKNNIHLFGGDASRITVFGNDAGSASSHFHALTPYSRGLVRRIVLHSGSACCRWATREDHKDMATRIARRVNCIGPNSPINNSTQVKACLKHAPLDDLILAPVPPYKLNVPYRMVPRVDGDFIPDHPIQLMEEGKHDKVDMMSGTCRNERGALAELVVTPSTYKDEYNEDFDITLPMLIAMDQEAEQDFISRRALFRYTDNTADKIEYIKGVEKMFTDCFLVLCQEMAATYFARDTKFGKRVYRYEVQHNGEASFGQYFNLSMTSFIVHGDELQYLADTPFGYPPVTREDDIFLSELMVTLWTNFARTGDPTPNMDLGFKWNPMETEHDFRFLSITTSPKMTEDTRKERRDFWRNMPMRENKIRFPEKFASSNTQTCFN